MNSFSISTALSSDFTRKSDSSNSLSGRFSLSAR